MFGLFRAAFGLSWGSIVRTVCRIKVGSVQSRHIYELLKKPRRLCGPFLAEHFKTCLQKCNLPTDCLNSFLSRPAFVLLLTVDPQPSCRDADEHRKNRIRNAGNDVYWGCHCRRSTRLPKISDGIWELQKQAIIMPESRRFCS